jgi:uncharacterized Zn finger protein
MANYKGRTFTSACDECGEVYTATHQYKADSRADACYEKHFPKDTRDTRVVMDEIKEQIPDWDGGNK